MKLQRLLPWAIALLLSGCASGQDRPDLPYGGWAIGLGAPSHMEVWVESVDVIDRRGLVFERVHGGIVSYTGNPVGWPKLPPGGGSQFPGLICRRLFSCAGSLWLSLKLITRASIFRCGCEKRWSSPRRSAIALARNQDQQ